MILKNDFITMLQKELNERFKDEISYTKEDTEKIMASFSEVITQACIEDGGIRIQGVGDIFIKRLPGRVSVNPRTGKDMVIPEQNQIKFKYSSVLKSAVND